MVQFSLSTLRVKIGIDTSAVKWNKTIEENLPPPEDIQIDHKNFSVKRELEKSDEENDLNLKKIKVSNFDSDFEDRDNNSEWLKKVPQHPHED